MYSRIRDFYYNCTKAIQELNSAFRLCLLPGQRVGCSLCMSHSFTKTWSPCSKASTFIGHSSPLSLPIVFLQKRSNIFSCCKDILFHALYSTFLRRKKKLSSNYSENSPCFIYLLDYKEVFCSLKPISY